MTVIILGCMRIGKVDGPRWKVFNETLLATPSFFKVYQVRTFKIEQFRALREKFCNGSGC